ncbi:MAG: hypothetical protein EOP86_10690 [Verrucomicrobiaceae bacterium]|nr:MAG: hypothetical protein EOP86_10690 [Verrucomicrobiaceae bacterium]
MKETLTRPDLLGTEVHTAFVWVLAAALMAVWMASHAVCRRLLSRSAPARVAGAVIRVVLGMAALWAFWQGVARHLVLETTWPLTLSGFIGALAIESVLGLYRLELKIVPRLVGRWLLALRLTAVAAVLVMLGQPVFSRNETRRLDRNVVVMLDESDSMQLADTGMPVRERLALAEFLGVKGIGQRPAMAGRLETGLALAGRLEAAAESVRPPDGTGESASKDLIEQHQEELRKTVTEAQAWEEETARSLHPLNGDVRGLDELRRTIGEGRQLIEESARSALQSASEGIARRDGRRLRPSLREAASVMRRGIEKLSPAARALEERFYEGIPEDVRQRVAAAASRTRRDLALEAVTGSREGRPGLLDALAKKYTLKFMRFGSGAAEEENLSGPAPQDAVFRSGTDLTTALEKARSAWPAENLAGVVMLSDARHNGPVPPDDAARKLGLLGAPLCPVVTGTEEGARDAAVTGVVHADSVFLGDRLRVSADLKLDRMRGEQVRVRLLRGAESVSEQTLTVPDDAWRTTVKLDDLPAEKGIYSWKVSIDPVKDELFAQNNEWAFDAAVSDDRTNVLLIDDVPRWEFRYLRNLFDSRDKSVHLQYVLLHPDTVEGAPPPPAVPASAGRPFGESEATRLPATPEEWRKFDVIILGDVPPDRVDAKTWAVIRDCVGSRGAMLVLVAGRNFLPHAFNDEAARELIPVKYNTAVNTFAAPAEPAFKLALTAEGRNSPVFAQSLSGMENERIWREMPVMRWRHAHLGAKEGAQVLAWAQPVPVDAQGVEMDVVEGPPDNADPAGELVRRRAMENRNALVVASQVDLGKVVMLTFDQTWRFRYGIGDTAHHRFWGQLLRWGAGESLPSGTEAVRLGTDRLSYLPGQAVTVRSRLTHPDSGPVLKGDLTASIFQGGKLVASKKMEYRKDSQGMYEASLEGLPEPGEYRVEVSGPDAEKLLAKEGMKTVEQKIMVGAAGNAVELGEVTADRGMAARLAGLTGGVVTGLTDTERLLNLFGPETKEVRERRETSLWDNWILLVTAVAALTAEWILRRRNALS